MRNPARLSKTLRRREAVAKSIRRGAYGMAIPDGLCGAYTADEGGEWWCRRGLDHAGSHAPFADPVADRPRLRIKRDPVTGRWCWWVTPFPTPLLGHAATQAQALAVGLAALETASVRSRT